MCSVSGVWFRTLSVPQRASQILRSRAGVRPEVLELIKANIARNSVCQQRTSVRAAGVLSLRFAGLPGSGRSARTTYPRARRCVTATDLGTHLCGSEPVFWPLDKRDSGMVSSTLHANVCIVATRGPGPDGRIPSDLKSRSN